MRKILYTLILGILLLTGCASAQKETTAETDKVTETSQVKKYSEAKKNYSSAYEYMRQGNYEKAKDLLIEAIDDSTTYIDAYLALRKVYINIGDLSSAIETCQEGISCVLEFTGIVVEEELNRANRKLTLALADLYAKLDQPGKADNLFKDIIEDEPDDANSYDLYASYLQKQGEIDEAIKNYEKAYELDPENKGIAFRLGDAYFEAKRYRDAVTFFTTAKKDFPEDIDIIKKIAESYMNLGEYKNAISKYEEIIKIAPKHVSSRINIGNAYVKLKNYNEAEKYYKEALSIEKNNLSVYYQLLNMELSRNRLSAVRHYLDEAFKLNPNDQILLALHGEYYYNLGLIKMNAKEWNPAIERFEKAISIWNKTIKKAYEEEWRIYAIKGINRAEKNIKEIKKVRW